MISGILVGLLVTAIVFLVSGLISRGLIIGSMIITLPLMPRYFLKQVRFQRTEYGLKNPELWRYFKKDLQSTSQQYRDPLFKDTPIFLVYLTGLLICAKGISILLPSDHVGKLSVMISTPIFLLISLCILIRESVKK